MTFPSPKHAFWTQFRNPQKAYWNMAAAIRRYRNCQSIAFPNRCDDYKVAAWEMAHGMRPIPEFLERQ